MSVFPVADTAIAAARELVPRIAARASATRRGHPLARVCRDVRCGALRLATSNVCADGGDPDHDTESPHW